MSREYEFAGCRFLGKKFTMNQLHLSESSFIVASVEAGNTTTKCILTATDLKTGKTEIIGRCVRLTRDIQPPPAGAKVFGKTVAGTPLTKETLADLIRDTIRQALFEKNLTAEDVHFVVRSTGVIAETGEQMEQIVLALAEGCLLAGFSPRKMTGFLTAENLPEKLRPYSYLNTVYFDGAVAGVLPPAGGEGTVSNEMEGELALAGLKEAGKHTGVDFRNPCIVVDMGTTLSGRVVNAELPYARTTANFCGYAGAVADALLSEIHPSKKSAFELLDEEKENREPAPAAWKKICRAQEAVLSKIHVAKIPAERKQFGPFRVNPIAAKKAGVILFGCDVGENGTQMKELSTIGAGLYEDGGMTAVSALIDEVMSDITVRLMECLRRENMLHSDTVIGITGRAGTTGRKKELTLQKLKKQQILDAPETRVIFVEDGLARGAAVMARCMNSLGCPNNPIGGRRGDKCIMTDREKLQHLRHERNRTENKSEK